MWIRVTSDPVVASAVVTGDITQNVSLHSWEAIYWNDGLKKWQANPAAYGNASTKCATICDYDAVISADLGNLTRTTDASLTNNTTAQSGVTPYFAVRDPVSRRLIAATAGKAKFNAQSTETVLMILGTYDEYKNCPDVPPSPPLAPIDYCNSTSGTELCVPAYAYAVYQRCGYVWNKIGDTRDYQVWANELNGGSAGTRRFHIPRWGGIDTTTGMPSPDDECMGLAFLNSGAGSLTCNCPPCLSSPPPGVSLCVRFRTIPRPTDPPDECGGLIAEMDAQSAWDKEYTIELTPVSGSFCSASGISSDGVFTFNWEHQDGVTLGCDWGPDVFDPCDPCAHWGHVYAYIEVPGGVEPNCGGSGHWRGEFREREICNLLCDCDSPPVTPRFQSFCNGCGNNATPPAVWNAICPDSLEVFCCPSDSILGGTATSSPSDGVSGGNSTTSYDAYYGGDA